jgi:glycosyltransferase involved in cell wall biosynthesis
MLDPWSLSQKPLKKRMYMFLRLSRNLNRAAAIHYTDAMEAELAGALHLRPWTIVEPCFVDTSEFAALGDKAQMRQELRTLFPQIGDRPVILFFGRIHPKKGLDLLIPAFAQAKVNNAVLLLVGPDPEHYMAQVRRMVQVYELEGRVIEGSMLVGRARLAALAGADLFVLPSYQENFGMAVVESLAAGTSVIVSDRVNIHRYITQGGVGEVVPPTVLPLAKAMTRWMQDATLRNQAGARARPYVAERFNLDIVADHWLNHYHRLAKGDSVDEVLSHYE